MKKVMWILIVWQLTLGGCNSPSSQPSGGAPVAAKSDIDRLQGTWVIERLEANGKVVPLKEIVDKEYTFKGNQLLPSKNPNDPATVELTPEKKPAWIDMTDRQNKISLGIYRSDGDRWEICVEDGGVARPTEFSTAGGKKRFLMVLRRKEKK